MPARRTQHRLTLHVEGRGGGALMLSDGARELAAAPGLADFEKIATTELRGDVSRLLLFQQVCDIMCTEALLYEDSVEVATQIATAVELGSVVDAAPGSRQPLVGRGTSANLQLAVSHTLEHGSVRLALGVLCVAVDGAMLQTSVSALRMDCQHGAQTFCLTAQLTPKGHSAYSESFLQTGSECKALRGKQATPRVQKAQAGTLSHYNHRVNCQQVHSQNVLQAAKIPASELDFSTRELLSRKVSRISTPKKDGAETVHTVFFR